MTQRKDFKKRVRARAEKTGESYSTARQQVARQATPEPAPGASNRFDRLTARAKRALAAAQEAAGTEPLQTEHVLLGIARQLDGQGARLLGAVAGGTDAVIAAAAAAGQEPETALRGALEAAYHNAANRGDRRVRTQDLLAGLLAVPSSNAARILESFTPAGAPRVQPATVADLLRTELSIGPWSAPDPEVLLAWTDDLDLLAREVMLLDPPDDLIALGRDVIRASARTVRQQDQGGDELRHRYRARLRSWLREALGAE